MSWFPVAMSLGATYFSALTVLTTPVEFYSYGTMYVYIIIAYLICIILCAELFVPMYKRKWLIMKKGFFSYKKEFLTKMKFLLHHCIIIFQIWDSVYF